eukprot:430604-Prorocentrum_minimum.AAC.1
MHSSCALITLGVRPVPFNVTAFKVTSSFATWHYRFSKARRVQACTTLSWHKAYTKFGARVGADRLSFRGGVVKTPFW